MKYFSKSKFIFVGLALGLFFFLGFAQSTFAANRYWVGSAGGNTNDTANWSTAQNSCGVSGGASVPTSADVAYFTSSCTNAATINVTTSWLGINIAAGTVSVASGADLTLGSYTQSGGTFTAPSGTMTVSGNITVSSGTFNHNNGTIVLTGSHATANFLANTVLNNLTIQKTNGNFVDFNFNTIINGTFNLSDGLLHGVSLLTINGDMVIGVNYDGYAWAPGTIIFGGSSNQTITNNNTSGLRHNITVNKSGGTLSLEGIDLKPNSVTMTAGIVGVTSSALSIYSYSQSGGTFNGGSSNITITTTLTQSGGTFNAPSGNLSLGSNMTISGSAVFNHNNGTIVAIGASNTIVDVNSTINLNNFNISKSINTAITYPANGDTVNILGQLTLTNGMVGYNSSNGILVAKGAISVASTSDGNWSNGWLGYILINGTGDQSFTVPVGATMPFFQLNSANTVMTVAGSLSANTNIVLQAGTLTFNTTSVSITSFTQSGGTFNGGNGTITNSGNTVISAGTYNATSGTTNISAYFNVATGATFNHNNGSFYMSGTWFGINIPSGITLNNLNVDVSNYIAIYNTQTLTVAGTLTLTNGQLYTPGSTDTSTLKATGNVVIGAGFDGTGGDGSGNNYLQTLLIEGTGSQSVSIAAGAYLPKMTLNNASSTLTFTGSGTVTFEHYFTLQAGTVTAGTPSILFNNHDYARYTQSGGTFNGGSTTFTAGGPFTVSGGTYNATTGNLYVYRWFDLRGGTFNHNNGTVIFYSTASAQYTVIYLPTTTYSLYNVVINKANSYLMVIAGYNLQVDGTLTLTDGSFIGSSNALSGTPGYLYAKGSVSVASTFDGGDGTGPYDNYRSFLVINGSGTQTVTVAAGAYLPAIDFDNSSATMSFTGSGTINFERDLILRNGTVTATNQNISICAYDGTCSYGQSFNQSGGTFNSGSGTFTIGGNFTQSGGIFNATPGNMNVYRNFSYSGGTFNHNNGTVIFTNNSDTTFPFSGYSTFSLNNVTINKSSSRYLMVYAGKTLQVDGTLTLTDGEFIGSNNASGGTIGYIEAKGPVSIATTFDGGSGSGSFDNYRSQINISGAGTQNISIPGGAYLPILNINNPAATVTLTGSGTVTSDLGVTVSAGVLDLAGVNFTISNTRALTVSSGATLKLRGSETVTITTVTLNSGSTVEYTATTGSNAIKNWTYTNATVNINGSGGTFTLPADKTFGNLTITAGTLSQGTYGITMGASGTLTVEVAGFLSNISTGDLTLGSGGVVNNGYIQLDGSGAGGGGTDAILIRSTTNGVQRPWTNPNSTGYFDLRDVDVRDQGQDASITVYSGTNTGHNTANWVFSGLTDPTSKTWRGTTNSTWSTGSNWVEGSAPTGSDVAIFTSAYSNPAIFNATAVSPATIQISGGYNSTITLNSVMSVGNFIQSGGIVNAQNAVSGLVGYWKLDAGNGSTAIDSSENGNTGTLVNSPIWSSVVPSAIAFSNPYALGFNGSNQYVSVPNSNSIAVGGNNQPISLSAWIKWNGSTEAYNAIVVKTDNNTSYGNGYALYLKSNQKLAFYLNAVNAQIGIDGLGSTIPFNTWTNVVATYDGSTMKTYINGQLDYSESGKTLNWGVNNLAPLIIGHDTFASGRYFNGYIDDVRVYNRVLSPSEVLVLALGQDVSATGLSTVNFTQSGGTFQAGSVTSVSGNFTRTGGTFTANGGTVNLTGTNQTVTGNTTFSNLTKTVTASSTLTFGAGQTTTITGTTTLSGATGQLLYLRSSNSPTQWRFDPQGGRVFSYLDVKDSNNINATVINAANYTGLTDASGPDSNINWTFLAPILNVSATGTQQSSTTMPVSGKYMGGAFVLQRNTGTGQVTSIALTQSGSLSTANISNIILFYKNAVSGQCSVASTVPADAVTFNSVSSVSWSAGRAIVSGSVDVGTTPVCIYPKFTLTGNISINNVFNTVDLRIADPLTDVVSSGVTVSPATVVDINGVTVVDSNLSGLPGITLTIASSSLQTGASTVLNWTTTLNPTSCTASGDWSGGKPTTGTNVSTGVLSVHKTYRFTLSCENNQGVSTVSVYTIVTDPRVPTLAMSIYPTDPISSGGSAEILWDVTDGQGGYPATSCLASGPVSWSSPSSKDTSGGVQTINDITASNYYSLVCGNQFGSTTKSVLIRVASAPTPSYTCSNGVWLDGPNAGLSCDYSAGSGNTVVNAILDSFILRTNDPATDPTVFFIMSDGRYNSLYMRQGPVGASQVIRKLTADDLTISSGTFTKLSCEANDCRGLKIDLNVQKKTPDGSLQSYPTIKTFKTTAIIRNN